MFLEIIISFLGDHHPKFQFQRFAMIFLFNVVTSASGD